MENRKSSGKLVLPRSRACFRASPSKSANKPVKAFFFHPIPVAAVVKTILLVKQNRERREGIGVARVDPLSSLRVAFKKTFGSRITVRPTVDFHLLRLNTGQTLLRRFTYGIVSIVGGL